MEARGVMKMVILICVHLYEHQIYALSALHTVSIKEENKGNFCGKILSKVMLGENLSKIYLIPKEIA